MKNDTQKLIDRANAINEQLKQIKALKQEYKALNSEIIAIKKIESIELIAMAMTETNAPEQLKFLSEKIAKISDKNWTDYSLAIKEMDSIISESMSNEYN